MLVLRLCTSDSVEIKLLKRATSKLALERLVIRKGAFLGAEDGAQNSKVSLSAQDLMDVLQGSVRYKVQLRHDSCPSSSFHFIPDVAFL